MKAIITFHSIDSSGSVISYPQSSFVSFLKALRSAGMPVLLLDELLDPATQRGVALTFDDGVGSVFTEALPVLRDQQLPAHVFLTTSSVGQHNRWKGQPENAPDLEMLTWDQVEQLHRGGLCIESHTHTHPDLRSLSSAEIEQECAVADDAIKQVVGRSPKFFAYPYGYRNQTVCEWVSQRYMAAVTTELDILKPGPDMAQLPRLDSYYLQSEWMRTHLDSAASRLYFSFRGRLRSLRGTQ